MSIKVTDQSVMDHLKQIALSKGTCPLFVTGTDTDIGKTYISGYLAKALNNVQQTQDFAPVGYYKAAISGSVDLEHSDAGFVQQLAALKQDVHTMTPYHFVEPLSPHLAAERKGMTLSFDTIIQGFEKVYADFETVVFEGTGGLYCPFGKVAERWFTILDIMQFLNEHCGLGVVLVGPSGLGSINQICCSFTCLQQAGFNADKIVIVMNNFEAENPMHQSNLATVRDLCPCKRVFTVAHQQDASSVFGSVDFLKAMSQLKHKV